MNTIVRNLNRITLLIGISAAAIFPISLFAQDPDSIGDLLGRRVRVHVCGGTDDIIGRFEGTDTTMLRLTTHDGALTRFPLANLQRVEAASRDRGLWAQIGLFSGAAVGALTYLAWSKTQYGNDEFAPLIATFVAAPIGGLVGAPVGALAAPERWHVVFRATQCVQR